MATALIDYLDDVMDAVKGLAAALIGRASNPPYDYDTPADDEDET